MSSPSSAPQIPTDDHRLELIGEHATIALARTIARLARPGDVIALSGDLGTGKSTWARGFLRALGVEGEVPSPTFTLVQAYDTTKGPVAHFDLYRLKRAEDLYELGFEDALSDGIALIEWPERAGRLLPRDRLTLTLTMGAAPDRRIAVLSGGGDWPLRLVPLRNTGSDGND